MRSNQVFWMDSIWVLVKKVSAMLEQMYYTLANNYCATVVQCGCCVQNIDRFEGRLEIDFNFYIKFENMYC